MTTLQLDLKKSTGALQLVLNKRGIRDDIRAAVGLNIDVSGSTKGLFSSGAMQAVVERILPVGLRFDDNGELDMWVFSDGERKAKIAGATEHNYQGYVDREIRKNPDLKHVLWGSTYYGPVIEANLKHYGFLTEETTGSIFNRSTRKNFGRGNGAPVINYFITDGGNDSDDRDPCWELLQRAQNAAVPIYYLFVGIGPEKGFGFLKKAADAFGNTGFVSVSDLDRFVNDDAVYEALLPDELCDWLKK